MKKFLSIIREAEYANLKKLSLDGLILDVGGSKNAYYHSLIGGSHDFKSINIRTEANPDFIFDIEKIFPLQDETYDHSVCLNVLEHVYEFDNAFSEQVRCVKKGGNIVIAVPFMHHIHGSPDDFIRFTESALKRMGKKYGCEITLLETLGEGLFCLLFQCIYPAIPTLVFKSWCKKLFIKIDYFLNKISQKYSKLSTSIPLGYFVIYKKIQ